jgi:hypothetical protein
MLSDFIGKPISLQAEPSYSQEQYDIVPDVSKFGVVTPDKLYDPPFTQVSPNGPDGVFDDATVEELIAVIDRFRPGSDQAANP